MIRQPLRTNGTSNVDKNAAHVQTHVMGKRLHGRHSTGTISFSAPNSWWRELICLPTRQLILPCIHVRGSENHNISSAYAISQSRAASHIIAALSFMQMVYITYGRYGQSINHKHIRGILLVAVLLRKTIPTPQTTYVNQLHQPIIHHQSSANPRKPQYDYTAYPRHPCTCIHTLHDPS